MVRRIHTRVASRSVLGKRRRAGNSVGVFKRRRITRSSRSNNFTSQRGSGSGLRFRSRRIGRRTWNRLLWRSTLQAEHYRANSAESGTITSPANVELISIGVLRARYFDSAGFWTTTGGAINPEGGAIPAFSNGDIVIRGGVMGLRLCNQLGTATTSETLYGCVYLCRTNNNFNIGGVPASASVGWEPSLVPDFKVNIGRIVYSKKFLLRDTETANVEYRMPIQKIDQSEFIAAYNDYVWVLCVGNTDNAGARVLTWTTYFNLSFVGDAV